MAILILGVVIFFGIHMLPAFSLQAGIVNGIGEARYKMGFTLLSFLGLGLIIYGFSLAEFVPLWNPPTWGRSLAIGVMPIVIILLCAADAPNNIKRFVRHPMLIGITLWAAVHLAANGDMASTILFVSFLTFSVLDIVLVETSGRFKTKDSVSPGWDIGIVIGGILLYGVLFYFHGWITGMPLM